MPGGISEAVNLYAVALRTRQRLYYDAANAKITNVPEAQQISFARVSQGLESRNRYELSQKTISSAHCRRRWPPRQCCAPIRWACRSAARPSRCAQRSPRISRARCRQLAGIGFKTIEMCSPHSYAEFRPLASMARGPQIRHTIEAAGLRCESCHYGFRELKENLDDRMAFAKELGLKQMVLASFGLPADGDAGGLDAGGRRNSTASASRHAKAGIQLGFHNHNNEFQEIDGVLIYDELMRAVRPQAGQDAIPGCGDQPGLSKPRPT